MKNNNIAKFTSLEEYKQHVNDCLDHSIPLFLVGPPGCGKSETTQQLTIERGANYFTHPAQLLTVSELTGFLFVNREEKSFDPFHSELSKMLLSAKEETVFHIQDLLLAKPEVRDALMTLIRLREIHGVKISDHIKFLIDTNDNAHGAGRGTQNTALNNRASIIYAFIDTSAWLKWALSNDIAKEIILFVHANPEFAYIDEGDIPKNGFEQFNTFRSWAMLSDFVKKGRKSFPVIQSIVGNVNDVAAEFLNFWHSLDQYGNLIAKVKNDPQSAPMFDLNQADKILGAVFILSNHLEKSNVPNFVEYINRYQNSEYTSLLLNLGAQTHPDAKETKEYVSEVVKGGK
jgi:hypothetical protein